MHHRVFWHKRHRNIGRIYYLSRDFGSATKALLEARKRNAADPMTHYYLGLIALEREEWQRALEALGAATQNWPLGNPDAWYQLGVAGVQARQWNVARDALLQYLKVAKNREQKQEARSLLKEVPKTAD